jgi:hypothetical protein
VCDYRKYMHTDIYLQATSHHPAACKRSITPLMDKSNQAAELQPIAAPYRTSTGDPRPAPPIEITRETI